VFERVLIANRGEIAVRIARTLRRLGIEGVAVHTPPDAGASHVCGADRVVALSDQEGRSGYLDVEQIVDAARRSGAQAVHPGYGFLAESADAARVCADAGLTWVGPPPEAIELLGDKIASKRTARDADVPVVPGLESGDVEPEQVRSFAAEHGLPVLLKASAGGGGKGMRRIDDAREIDAAVVAARREAQAAFGHGALLVERLIEPARHVEVQVVTDPDGEAFTLGERECSLQRRHQKLMEESPAPGLDDGQRQRLADAAVRLAEAAGYRNLGTVEFLVDPANPDAFFFLEMNARLQVEHPITELVWGLDLVELQLRIAAGEPVSRPARAVRAAGHAIEARVCAERPAAGFLPATGRVVVYEEPAGEGVRVDSGIGAGTEVTTAFDSLLAKVVCHGASRQQALERLDRALAATRVLGVETNTAFLRRLLATPEVREGRMTVDLVESRDGLGQPSASTRAGAAAALAAVLHREASPAEPPRAFEIADGWRQGPPGWARWHLLGIEPGEELKLAARVVPAGLEVAAGGEEPVLVHAEPAGPGVIDVTPAGARRTRWHHARAATDLWLGGEEGVWCWREAETEDDQAQTAGSLEAELPGKVVAVSARAGDEVSAGQSLLVIESMKMELDVSAPSAGTVGQVHVAAGEHVQRGQVLVSMDGGGQQ
jgi:acetyl-CoA/propionyl-CoA carboxylase biotin carboxyl carrier protein